MINQAAITECFRDLIGFEEDNIQSLAENLKTSNSGIYVQKLHPLLSIDNLLNCHKITDVEDFSTYLYKTRDSAIIKLINNIYTAKHLNENSKELLTEVRMYEGVGNFANLIVKQDRFVGYRIALRHKDLSLFMRNVGLQFDTVNPEFKLYIYHSSQSEPLHTIDIVHDKANSFVWKALTEANKKLLPTISGGYYLIGYYEQDLLGQAVKRDQYFQRAPSCTSCEHVNYELYKKWSQYVDIYPFYVTSDLINYESKGKWNEGAEIFIDGTNWGLNLALSVVCDPSGLFCRNRELFADALGKQIAVEFLNDIAYSGRDNQLKQKASQMAFFALGNRDNNQPGMLTELEKAIKAINFNMGDLNPVCLPCQDEAYRVRHTTVY